MKTLPISQFLDTPSPVSTSTAAGGVGIYIKNDLHFLDAQTQSLTLKVLKLALLKFEEQNKKTLFLAASKGIHQLAALKKFHQLLNNYKKLSDQYQ